MTKTYSVGELTHYIAAMFSQDYLLKNVSVSGEVSNCKYHSSGHIYFSIKDRQASMPCVMFQGQRKGLAFRMKDGDKVVVSGYIGVYERDGRYQLYARQISLEGAGALYERYLALKKELAEMGMFAQEYKQPIPRMARRIGIVTAPTGAAIRDIQNIALRRNPYVQLILYPAYVQGENAKESIVKGIETLDRAGVDLIIVGRGGGSIEDLWAFNEECVARAVFECQTPVISAVGHETDFTIVDEVADLRAPTPSAAAELATMDVAAFDRQLLQYRERLKRDMFQMLSLKKQRLKQYSLRLTAGSPENRLLQQKQYLDDIRNRLQARMQAAFDKSKSRMALLAERLHGLSPLARLQMGYAFVTNEAQESLRSVAQIAPGDTIRVHVTDGRIKAVVLETEAIDRQEEV